VLSVISERVYMHTITLTSHKNQFLEPVGLVYMQTT